MSEFTPAVKDISREGKIPTLWRSTFAKVVEAFLQGDFTLANIPSVKPISLEDSSRINQNIKSYGARLSELPDETWRTSSCRWMGKHWDALVDMYTKEEGQSDLVLFSRVYEADGGYEFKIDSVHVP